MSFSAFTPTHVESFHNPNEGRTIINTNFDGMVDSIATMQLQSATGATIVSALTNMQTTMTMSGILPVYTVSTVPSPSFTSLSAQTFYSGGTNLGDLLMSYAPAGGTTYGSQYTVTALGTNFYSGSSIPSITGYSTGAIYLTQFQNTNSVTGVTMHIDGQPTIDVLRGNDEGLGPLEIGEIQTGITYFLTYDGSQFQMFNSSPQGTPGTYTNLNPATVAVGGVPVGTTFSATTWQAIMESMFYPTLAPNFSSFVMRATTTGSTQSQALEVGNSVSGGTRVFTWGTTNSSFVKPGTIKIYNVTSGNIIISSPSSGITNDGNEVIGGLSNIQKTTSTSHIWRIYGTRTNSSTFNASFQVNWYWRRMFGVSSATTMTTSASVNAFSGTGSLSSTLAGTYNFVGAGYKYFFWPTTFGSPSLFKDVATNLSIAMADSSDNIFFSGTSGLYSYGTTTVTNQFGIAQAYRVYRTRNYLNGNISIIVS